jgi:Sel1 repeat
MATLTNQDRVTKNKIPPLQIILALDLLLVCFVFLPVSMNHPRLAWSIVAGAVALLIALFFLRRQVARTGRVLFYEFVPKPVHYVQLTMHSCIYAYWGWYWREVYHQIPLIICQLVFAYALDMIVCWFRRDKWILGFGPFPIVLSTNLFLWFKPDWYFLQFLMLATGVLCKEFITWKRDGRRAHIFNPSAIALFVFSVGLIVTHSTQISWGEEIAVSFDRPPHIYMEIFLLGLVVQALFSVTLVTLSAAAALYALNLVYSGRTGLYYFVDTNIPAAVFLGLHLLVTDPATSPKKNFGKIVFGAGYGVLVFGLYWFLGLLGAPTFYDKLLCVPPLNLTVRALDRASAKLEEWFRMPVWNPKLANYAFMTIWIGLFAVMWSTGFLRGQHPGADEAFWRKACSEGRQSACDTWVRMMNIRCYHGGGPACLVLGIASNENQLIPRDQVQAGKSLAHACELGLSGGCTRLLKLVVETNGSFFQSACDARDGESCFLLGSLYYAGRGVLKDGNRAFALFERSCSTGWPRGCSGLGECYRAGVGTAEDNSRALELFDQACRADVASSCFSASVMYRNLNNEATAQKRLRQGCQISAGFVESSAAYAQPGTPAKAAALPAVCSSADR